MSQVEEIGGYIELEHYHGEMLHEKALKLNCGRNCLAYLIREKGIRTILMPQLMCDSVIAPCRENGVEIVFYEIGADLRPVPEAFSGSLPEDAWVYIMNYYGQLTAEEIASYRRVLPHMILDNAQAYFYQPPAGVDTIYTCRKFFGVPDGALLYTDADTHGAELEQSQSYANMEHLLGRFECGGSAFYQQSAANNHRFAQEPVMRMSALTENLLRSIDYSAVRARRTENFRYLSERLGKRNRLSLREAEGAFAYPFLTEHAPQLRAYLQQRRIYVPVLWPNVRTDAAPQSMAFRLADGILPLPCDQRYTETEMERIILETEAFFRSVSQ